MARLKTIAVSTRLTDAVAKSPNFLETIYDIFTVLAPFVQCLNEMILPTPRDDEEEQQSVVEVEEEEEEEEEVDVEDSDDGGKGNEGNDDGNDDDDE